MGVYRNWPKNTPRHVGCQSSDFPQVAECFTDLMGYIERLVDLYNRDLAEGLDRSG